MATSMEQIDLSKAGYKCEFSDSSEADIAHAKTFWKSILLMPPIESRLVSGDIRQRLKVAEPGQQAVNITHQPQEYPPQLTECLSRARELDEKERSIRYQEVNERRDKQRQLLYQQRQVRIQKEMMSGTERGLPHEENDDSSPVVEAPDQDEEIETCLRDLDEFDQRLRADRPPTPESRN